MKIERFFRKLFSFMVFFGLAVLCSCSTDDGPRGNDLTGLLSFGFTDSGVENYEFEVDNFTYVIKNKDSLPYQMDVSALTAKFTAVSGSSVKVNGVEQESGVTVNNFTDNIVYTVTSENGSSTREYRVQLDIAQLNPDEVQWSQRTPNAFSADYDTQEYFYLNGKHWAILGKEFAFNGSAETALYSSEDGSTWGEESPSGDFPVGFYHNVVVRGGKAYVVGLVSVGETWGLTAPVLEDVLYVTEDGVHWTKQEGSIDEARILTATFELEGSVYVLGGNKVGAFNSFTGSKPTGAPFYPAAGIHTTTLVATGSTFSISSEYTEEMPRRTRMASYVYEGKMYIAGGLGADGHPLSDVWSSVDGVNWSLVSEGSFDARMGASTVVYDGDIYMFGGQFATGYIAQETLISSDGGASWSPVSEEQALPSNYTVRSNAKVSVDANGYIWIVGGDSVENVELNEDGHVGKIEYRKLTDVWSGRLNKLR